MARPRKIQPAFDLPKEVDELALTNGIPDFLEATNDTLQVKPQTDCTCDQLPRDGMSYKCTDCVDREFNFRK